MRTPPLSKRDIANIAGMLNAASDLMQTAWNAHACWVFGPEMREAVMGVQTDMGRFLAFFEDVAKPGLTDTGSINTMRQIEMMATHLIEDTRDTSAAA